MRDNEYLSLKNSSSDSDEWTSKKGLWLEKLITPRSQKIRIYGAAFGQCRNRPEANSTAGPTGS